MPITSTISTLQSVQSSLTTAIAEIQAAPSGHPYFWPDLTDTRAKLATPEGQGILKSVTACANGAADKTGDRMLCAAFLYRLNNDAAKGVQAVNDLMSATVRQGAQDDIGWGGAPWSMAYDWLYPLLSASQKTALLGTATACLADRNTADGSTWRGYNQLSGDIPMALALAIRGDTATDYVADVRASNWLAPRPPFWNYYNQVNAWSDGGSREGFASYFSSCFHNFGTRGLYETATGIRTLLDIGYFRNAPYWFLAQLCPDTIVKGSWPTSLYTSTYSGGIASARGLWAILQACTTFSDANGKRLARWLLDQAPGGYAGVNRTAGQALLYGLLIGDPRVQGADPTTLGLPLTFTMPHPGEIFVRSDWTAQANVAWFANHVQGSRVTPAGEFALYSKGNPLIGSAIHRVGHSYGPRWLQPGVCFVDQTGVPAFGAINVGSVPDYVPRGTFSAVGRAVVADAAANFAGTVQKCLITFNCDPAVTSITLAYDVACAPTLTPHIVFPCPTQPTLNADGTVTITNGAASCTLSFSATPAQLLAIGGPGHYCDGLPGTAYEGKPYLFANTVLDADFAKLTEAAALRQMGYWRLHVALPAGGGKVTTTIKVQ